MKNTLAIIGSAMLLGSFGMPAPLAAHGDAAEKPDIPDDYPSYAFVCPDGGYESGCDEMTLENAVSLEGADQAAFTTRCLYQTAADCSVISSGRIQRAGIEQVLDRKLIEHARLALEEKAPISSTFNIRNTDRAVGAMLSNEISKRYKGEGLPDAAIRYRFRGSAGQSFGAFSACGLEFTLEGEANDYFGKGLSGARLVVAVDAAQEGALARSRRTVQHDAFARRHGEPFVLEHVEPDAALIVQDEALVQLLDGEAGRFGALG